MGGQRDLDREEKKAPVFEDHFCANAHGMESGDRNLDAFPVIFLKSVRMKLLAVDLEPHNVVDNHIYSLIPQGNLNLNDVPRQPKSRASQTFWQAFAGAIHPRPNPPFPARQVENQPLKVESIKSPSMERPIDSRDGGFEILLNNHSAERLDQTDVPCRPSFADERRIPMHPHPTTCTNGSSSIPLASQPRRILRNRDMQWMLAQHPSAPVADGRYTGQSPTDSNGPHPRLSDIHRCVPALPRPHYRLLLDRAGQIPVVGASRNKLAFLSDSAETGHQFLNVNHADSIVNTVRIRAESNHVGGLAGHLSVVE